jgi:two-component system OmpR family sensor kinase
LVAISEAQRGLWQHTLAVGFVGSAVALASGFVILNRGFRPLDRMINLLRQVRGKDLTIRMPEEPRPQELQYLADTLNSMMQRLHTTFTTREIFFAGVSHDLRTPLSLLQGQIDLLLMQPSLDPRARERLNSMSKEVSRLSRITNNLLLSAQLEAAPAFTPGEVDLKELVEEVVRETRPLSQGLRFNVSIPEIIGIFADYDLLKQMLLNVVDNAIKFTPRGGSVTLGLREVGQWAAITISDTGQGIPREKLTRLTEPFHRACTDQNPRKQGAGLGLAIVKQIINLHGGELEIQSEEGIGTTVTIRLPLSFKGSVQNVDPPVTPLFGNHGNPLF